MTGYKMETMVSLVENWSTSVLTLTCVITLALWWWTQRPKNAPPGPTGLPFIGSMIPLVKNARSGTFVNYMMDLRKKYGNVVSVQVGVQRLIFIFDAELLAQLYQKPEFSMKPVNRIPALRKLIAGSPRGVSLNNGPSHKEMRKFATISLKDFGVGKKSVDEMIETEGAILCSKLDELAQMNNGVVFEIQKYMQHATANMIHHIIFGFRYNYEDAAWIKLVQKMYSFFAIDRMTLPENFLPVLERMPAINNYLSGSKNLKFDKLNAELGEYVESQVENHRDTYVEGEVRDFVDLYLKFEREEREFYTKDNIMATILDLFRAGSSTTATALTWCVLYLVKYPEVQKQIREEVDEVVGEAPLDKESRTKLIKLQAFINEVHRYVSVAFSASLHTVERAQTVEGYTVLPNDLILGSLYVIHHDEDYWGDPFTFRIDRWINDKGELLKHEGHFYPFSVGRRVCPGRQFAQIEVITFLKQLIQTFKFEKADGYPELTEEWKQGFFRTPKNLYFQATRIN